MKIFDLEREPLENDCLNSIGRCREFITKIRMTPFGDIQRFTGFVSEKHRQSSFKNNYVEVLVDVVDSESSGSEDYLVRTWVDMSRWSGGELETLKNGVYRVIERKLKEEQ